MHIEDLKDPRDRAACKSAEKRRRPAFFSSGSTVRWKNSDLGFAIDAPGEDGQVRWPEPETKSEDDD
jgi:hypothetical protein